MLLDTESTGMTASDLEEPTKGSAADKKAKQAKLQAAQSKGQKTTVKAKPIVKTTKKAKKK